MIATVTIQTATPQTYSTGERLTALGSIRRPLSGNGNSAENANMTVTLDNGDGMLTASFAQPPLRIPASITVDGELMFSGTITAVTVAEQISIEVQA